MSSESKWITLFFLTCSWVIWNQWASFFFWLTSTGAVANTTMFSDFLNLYGNGKWWLAGAYVDPVTRVFSYPFAYPPTSLPIFGFFALFDFAFAVKLWIAMSLIAFIIAFLALLLVVNPKSRYLFASISCLLILTSYPLQTELKLGQINLLICSLTALSLVCQRLQHRFASAALLAMGTLLKGPPILFLVYFVGFRRDLTYLAHFLISCLAFFGLTLLVVPIQLYWYWLVNVFPSLFVGSGGTINESVLSPLSMWGFASFTPIILLTGVCLYATFAFCVNSRRFKRVQQSPLTADSLFLMNTLVLLLLGSRSWPQDYIWVILPAALMLSGLIVEDAHLVYFVPIAAATFLTNFDTYPLFPYYLNLPITMIPTGLLGSLVMFFALALYCFRHTIMLSNHQSGVKGTWGQTLSHFVWRIIPTRYHRLVLQGHYLRSRSLQATKSFKRAFQLSPSHPPAYAWNSRHDS